MRTETCSAISANNMCTLTCSSNTDCGESILVRLTADGGFVEGAMVDGGTDAGTFVNQCIDYGGSPLCMRGCSQTVADSCLRSDFVCITTDQGGSYYCVPDCRLQPTGFCSYPTQCNQTDGNCEEISCSTTSPCPARDGGVTPLTCATVNGASICVESCANEGCPAGSTCNSTGGCDTSLTTTFGVCGTDGGPCA